MAEWIRRLQLLILSVLISLLFHSETTTAQAISTSDPNSPAITQEIGPLFVRSEAKREAFGLSETVRYSVTIRSPDHVQVEMLPVSAGGQWGPFLVVSLRQQGSDRLEGRFGTLQLTTWVLELEPVQSGTLTPKPLEIRYRQEEGGEAESATVQLPAVRVVAEHVRDARGQSLRPLPELPAPTQPTDTSLQTILKVAGVLLFLSALIIAAVSAGLLRWQANPLQQASRQLDGLEKESPSDFRVAIAKVVDIVRLYLHREHDLPAEFRSTPEILQLVQKADDFSDQQRLALQDFLETADPGRFEQLDPTREDWLRCIQRARSFLFTESSG